MNWKAPSGVGLQSYADILGFSTEKPEVFWLKLWEFCGVVAETRGKPVLVDGDKMPGGRFFPDARLNYAENLLRRNDDGPALVFRGEDKVKTAMTWRQLNARVAQTHRALARAGIKPGDRVCAVVPNHPETIVAFLAAASLGGHLVVLLAGFRRARHSRPLRPDCAQAPVHLRWLLL